MLTLPKPRFAYSIQVADNIQGNGDGLVQPGEHLTVHMENRQSGEKVFDASLSMSRRELTGPNLARALVRHPWMTARVGLGIYWQAARLWMKGTPFHPHPRTHVA